MSKRITIEGVIYWPFFSDEDPNKQGFHTFELGQLSDEDITAIEGLGTSPVQHPRTKKIDKLKRQIKSETNPDVVARLETRLEWWEQTANFIALKQNTTRLERNERSVNYGKRVKFPLAVRRADGSYYTADEARNLGNGTRVKCDIETFDSKEYGSFFRYVPSSLFVLEEVLFERSDGEFHESELAEEPTSTEPAPFKSDVQAPLSEVDPLDDELPI